jgi:hypothetical protein
MSNWADAVAAWGADTGSPANPAGDGKILHTPELYVLVVLDRLFAGDFVTAARWLETLKPGDVSPFIADRDPGDEG